MGYEAMANGVAPAPAATPASRDAGKKKRTNRSAKLKQCKLDARREQWLNQVKGKDDGKVQSTGTSPTLLPSPPPAHLPRNPWTTETISKKKNGEDEGDNMVLRNKNNLDSSMHNQRRKGSPSHSISSGSSMSSSSRSVSDAEEEEEYLGGREEDNGVLDDWEAVADALSEDSDGNHPDPGPVVPPVKPAASPCIQNEAPCGDGTTKPEPIRSIPRAWRPDDTSRPQSLPSISKQLSFPVNMERQCGVFEQKGILSLPSPCPICCEDLDPTDSSFLPCSCGYHLCLFCHKRILETDGRCPGCRKQYDSKAVGVMEVKMEANAGQLPRTLLFGFSRSYSMNSRF